MIFKPRGTVRVRVSAKAARLLFEGCTPFYIQNVCKGACCRVAPNGPVVVVEEDQRKDLIMRGAKFRKGFILKTVDNLCMFHDPATGFCGVHFTGFKPRSCIQSPFVLTVKDTLIVTNRYKMLGCYRVEGAVPAYKAFRDSLDILFGLEEAARVCEHLDEGGGDIYAYMLEARYHFAKVVIKGWREIARSKDA